MTVEEMKVTQSLCASKAYGEEELQLHASADLLSGTDCPSTLVKKVNWALKKN
jgi:hypothetical protein